MMNGTPWMHRTTAGKMFLAVNRLSQIEPIDRESKSDEVSEGVPYKNNNKAKVSEICGA
jgi:hypothetical protein